MSILKQLIKGNTTTIILSLLREEPMYGYQLVREIGARSKKYFTLREGTIYPLLHSLERQELIEGSWQKQGNKPARKYYQLTAKGEKVLATNLIEWKNFSLALNSLLRKSYG